MKTTEERMLDVFACQVNSKLRKLTNDKRRYVYIIGMGDGTAYKIGVSDSPFDRLMAIRTGNPQPVSVVYVKECGKLAMDVEKTVHKYMKGTFNHMSGEWYNISLETAITLIENAFFRLSKPLTKELSTPPRRKRSV